MSVLTACPHCDTAVENDAAICSECDRPIDEGLASFDSVLKHVVGDRYAVVDRVGSGAFGEVFLARDTALEREVALKRVRLDSFHDADLASEMKQRALREAKMAAKLLHPNIVAVYDVLQLEDSTLIIMEYVDGVTLESRLNERHRLSFDETRELILQTAGALDYAHKHDVVHRDIKPANLIIERGGRIQIADFGIAKSQTGSNLTAAGDVIGTPHYMSPEQARGRIDLDGRADLFSLGCVMYECLVGQKPFQGNTMIEVLLQIVDGDSPELDCEALQLHDDVQHVLNKTLAKEAANRFASSAELIEALENIPATRTTETEPAGRIIPPAPCPVITSRPPGLRTSFDIGLQGSLSDTGLAETIQDILGSEKTGILHVQKDVSKRLYFLGGSIVFANSDVESDRLGQFMIRVGVIDEPTYDLAWRATQNNGRRFGATLVELGNLDHQKLNALVSEQIQEIIFSVFRWDEGQFGFEVIDRPVEEDIAMQLSTEQIILEGARKMASNRTIRSAIGSTERIARPGSSARLLNGKVSLTSSEGFVLSCIDGATSVADLVTISAIGEVETLRCLYGLRSAGIVTLEEPPSPVTQPGGQRPRHRDGFLPPGFSNEGARLNSSGDVEAILREVDAMTSAAGRVSHYELLEASRYATQEDIKACYFALVKKFHPDRHRSERFPRELQRRLEELLIQLRTAYDVLFDPTRRTAYDKGLPPPPPRPLSPPPPVSPPPPSPIPEIARVECSVSPPESLPELEPPPREPTAPRLEVASPPPAFTSPVAMARAQYRAGKAHLEENDFHDAVQSLREAVRLAPETPEYHHLLARALLNNPRWRKQAETHFRRVIELEPFETDGYLELARLYEAGRLETRAKKMYEKILELSPDHEIAISKLSEKDPPVLQFIGKSRLLRRLRGKGKDAEPKGGN